MIEIILISIVAFIASILTFFSGFGLGTLLMPFVAIFVPLDIAIAITAIVHFTNNLLKAGVVGKFCSWKVVKLFGFTAFVFAVIGASMLEWLNDLDYTLNFNIFEYLFETTLIKVVIGVIIIFFVVLEMVPSIANMTFNEKYLPYGGVLSGFFGGLSGNQGAFRSMFLLKAGLNKQEYIATGIMIAIIVDIARMGIYGFSINSTTLGGTLYLIVFASVSAFMGTLIGSKLLKKVSYVFVRAITTLLLIIIAVAMIFGKI